jgi:hypothetical protein
LPIPPWGRSSPILHLFLRVRKAQEPVCIEAFCPAAGGAEADRLAPPDRRWRRGQRHRAQRGAGAARLKKGGAGQDAWRKLPCLISRTAWDATPVDLKSEIIRRWREHERGIAICNDRRCGRRKRAPSPSFYALHLLEHDIWKFPTNTVKVAEAEEMRAKLAPDVERMAQNDALAEYHELAIQSGTTLAEALRKYVAVERRLREDPVAEIARIMQRIGVDPIEFARRYLDQSDAA